MFGRLLAAAALVAGVGAAQAGDIAVRDAYARSSNQKNGAAFMVIENHGAADDRLVAARSPAARKVELHTHVIADGVARMRPVEGGIPVPAGGRVALERGGLHVMFMGLTTPFEDGREIPLTLVFERAGEMALQVPVDNARRAAGHGGAQMGHGHMHGKTDGHGAAAQ
ncbi:copper chaperone PCu(A)C [Oceanicella actignis]|uniref:copper chaperone PCu(A)C n=1 Tax=Oceanicella actignis TaxID=1189325 RepID=UPI0012532BA3|nr:copper chaperone PCu(A)C [Oceanicella actignis]TYO89164.1 hypothetical protein LY05_01780 [Oceanicella actignis]